MLEQLDKPRKRFLRQVIRGILFSGSLVVMEFGRWVRDDCSDPCYRLKRLLNHLVSPRADLRPAISGYRQATSIHIAPDTALILDLTDLAKPRAKRMPYLNLVRDGSDNTLVMGYRCIEVYAYLQNKRLMPLAKIDDPADCGDTVHRLHVADYRPDCQPGCEVQVHEQRQSAGSDGPVDTRRQRRSRWRKAGPRAPARDPRASLDQWLRRDPPGQLEAGAVPWLMRLEQQEFPDRRAICRLEDVQADFLRRDRLEMYFQACADLAAACKRFPSPVAVGLQFELPDAVVRLAEKGVIDGAQSAQVHR
jgi:hypothetical protein